MNTRHFENSSARLWKDLYTAALFEADPAKIQQRIAEAEKALVLRARELFSAPGDNIEEQESLDDAMYALHALGNAYNFSTNATAWNVGGAPPGRTQPGRAGISARAEQAA